MKTANIFKTTFLLILLAIAMPFNSNAFISTPADPATEAANRAEVSRLENRLEEIKSLDHSKLSKGEKRALRSEVKQIKRQVNAIGGGVYVSIGALILVILLLILLL